LTFVFKKFIPAIVVFVLATVLLCLPGSALPDTGGNWFNKYQVDKIIHIIIFGSLTYLFCRPIQLKGFFTNIITKLYFIIAIIFTIYGVIIEFVQKWWVAGRSFDSGDILADAIGCFLAYFIAKNIIKKQKPPSKEELQNQLRDYAQQFLKK
jgi:hypothetical protein